MSTATLCDRRRAYCGIVSACTNVGINVPDLNAVANVIPNIPVPNITVPNITVPHLNPGAFRGR